MDRTRRTRSACSLHSLDMEAFAEGREDFNWAQFEQP